MTPTYTGIELFDADMVYMRQITRANGHRHTARQIDGKGVLVFDNSNEPNPRVFNEHAIVSIDLETAVQKKLLDLSWTMATHVTAGMGPVDHCWVGSYDGNGGGLLYRVWFDGRPPDVLPHGSSASSYESQPRPSVSRDGRYLAFNSDKAGRVDVYLVDLGQVEPPVTTPNPDGLDDWPDTLKQGRRAGFWKRIKSWLGL